MFGSLLYYRQFVATYIQVNVIEKGIPHSGRKKRQKYETQEQEKQTNTSHRIEENYRNVTQKSEQLETVEFIHRTRNYDSPYSKASRRKKERKQGKEKERRKKPTKNKKRQRKKKKKQVGRFSGIQLVKEYHIGAFEQYCWPFAEYTQDFSQQNTVKLSVSFRIIRTSFVRCNFLVNPYSIITT